MERLLCTDAEIDDWINQALEQGAHDDPGGWDQKIAATLDNLALFSSDAKKAIDHGLYDEMKSTSRVEPHEVGNAERAIIRLYLNAHVNGIVPLCEHTEQIRPLVLSCDPPAIHCRRSSCIELAITTLDAAGFMWDSSCDMCGAEGRLVTPFSASLGYVSMLAHICKPCAITVHGDTDD